MTLKSHLRGLGKVFKTAVLLKASQNLSKSFHTVFQGLSKTGDSDQAGMNQATCFFVTDSKHMIPGSLLWTEFAWNSLIGPIYKYVTEECGKASKGKPWFPNIAHNQQNFTLAQYLLFCLDPIACEKLPMLESCGQNLITQLCVISERNLLNWTSLISFQSNGRKLTPSERLSWSYIIQAQILNREGPLDDNRDRIHARAGALTLKEARDRFFAEQGIDPMTSGHQFKTTQIAAREIASRIWLPYGDFYRSARSGVIAFDVRLFLLENITEHSFLIPLALTELETNRIRSEPNQKRADQPN